MTMVDKIEDHGFTVPGEHPNHEDRLVNAINELIEVTNRQNEMLGLISDQVTPVLESMQNSPIGALLGMGK